MGKDLRKLFEYINSLVIKAEHRSVRKPRF